MDSHNVFKLSISLERLSAISVAINFWELPSVKKKTKDFFQKEWNSPALEWDKIIKFTLNQINLNFPEKLLNVIREFIVIIGVKLYHWIMYVKKILNCNFKYVEKIYFTPIGDIDELKIVRDWLKNSTKLGKINHKCFLNKPLFCIASAYAEKVFDRNHLEEMKNEISRYLPASCRKMKLDDQKVIAMWIYFCSCKTKAAAVKHFKTSSHLPSNQLFSICVDCGFKFAVYYFFDKLNDNEKENMVSLAALRCLNSNFLGYKDEINFKILLFLIKNMDETDKLRFVTQHFKELFLKLIYMWPYQEICLNFLIHDSVYSVPEVHGKLLYQMVLDLCKNSYKAKYFGKGIIYNKIFHILLENTQKNLKELIFTKNDYRYLKELLTIGHYDVLNVIFNDEGLLDIKDKMMKVAEIFFKNLVLKGHCKNSNKFMKLLSYEDEKSFKQKFNTLMTFLLSGEIELAEKHLNWLYDTDSERLAAKKQIDSLKVCTSLIMKNRYDLASKFLKWQRVSKKEQKNIKEKMISNGVVRDEVYKIWCIYREPDLLIPDVTRKCEELLAWFFESEEARIEFRKTKLVEDESFIEKYYNNLFHDPQFEWLDEFLKFCFWSSEEIENQKQKIANNFEWWLDTYALEKNNYLLVQALFTWAFKSDEEVKQTLSNYINSPKGVSLMLNPFKNSANFPLTIVQFFNAWIIKYDPVNIEEMKMALNAVNTSVVKGNIITVIKNLLEFAKKGEKLTCRDVLQNLSGRSYVNDDYDFVEGNFI